MFCCYRVGAPIPACLAAGTIQVCIFICSFLIRILILEYSRSGFRRLFRLLAPPSAIIAFFSSPFRIISTQYRTCLPSSGVCSSHPIPLSVDVGKSLVPTRTSRHVMFLKSAACFPQPALNPPHLALYLCVDRGRNSLALPLCRALL